MTKSQLHERDGSAARLLLFLEKVLAEPIDEWMRIKRGIWIADIRDKRWIIKERGNRQLLLAQIDLLKTLEDYGFDGTHRFHPAVESGPAVFEDRYFAVYEFIEEEEASRFHYQSSRNQADALSLLMNYHNTTSSFADRFSGKIPVFQQIQKWEKRLDEFEAYIPSLVKTGAYPYLKEYSRWGWKALHLLRPYGSLFSEEPTCIIHGDVAHHNFIRGKDGRLYLIDYDLISIASPSIDILQLSNRVLPYLGWSLKKLLPLIGEELGTNREFLIALSYPADIFREWNHLCRKGAVPSVAKRAYVMGLTVKQFPLRRKFISALADRISHL
ncbi:MAG TPA: phosphotransferase [Bacillaceae bacterium]